MTTTRTEYSIRYRDGQNGPWSNVQCVGGNMFTLPDELPRLQTVLIGTGAKLFRRTVFSSESEPVPEPLPTTPGSVVRATHGKIGTPALFARDDSNDGLLAWSRLDDCGVRWVSAEELANITVLFDAAEAQS
jgi:hypothetical protein